MILGEDTSATTATIAVTAAGGGHRADLLRRYLLGGGDQWTGGWEGSPGGSWKEKRLLRHTW